RIARKPVAMLNIGVGPLRTKTGLWLARRILSQVDLITVRDQKSYDTCRQIGIDATLVPDAVFSTDEEFLLRPADDSPAPRPGGPLRV
ncbi:polysaccharide pyruvyl transferase family protein, partial [Vibrio parahaemolyticus]